MKLYEKHITSRSLYPLSTINRILRLYIKKSYKAEVSSMVAKISINDSGFDIKVSANLLFHMNKFRTKYTPGPIKEYDWNTKHVVKRGKRFLRYKKLAVKLGTTIKENPHKRDKI